MDSDGDGIGDNADEFPDGDKQRSLLQVANAYGIMDNPTTPTVNELEHFSSL